MDCFFVELNIKVEQKYIIAVQLGYQAFIRMQAEKYYDVVYSNVMFLGESKNGHIIIIKLSIMQIKL